MKVPGTIPARYAPARYPGKPLAVIAARPLEMSTAVTAIRQASEHENPNVVKVVVNPAGRALHFSRRTSVFARGSQSFGERTVGGISLFETPRPLRLPAGGVVAAGAGSGCTARKRGAAGTIARVGKWNPHRYRERGLRLRGCGIAGRRRAGGAVVAATEWLSLQLIERRRHAL